MAWTMPSSPNAPTRTRSPRPATRPGSVRTAAAAAASEAPDVRSRSPLASRAAARPDPLAVPLDLREVLGQLRSAPASVPAPLLDAVARQGEPCRDLQREAAARR